MVKIGIVAGEASGDALGAALIRAVKGRLPAAIFVGVGGPQMQNAGCVLWAPASDLALAGYIEVLSHLPRLIRFRRRLCKRFRAERIALFVGVDAPDFNLGLEARLKALGVRTMHYVSPSVWAWRRERLPRIGRAMDHMLALFPFEVALYRDAGIPVTFVGHPLAARETASITRSEARANLRLEALPPIIALLPGSRKAELAMHSGLLLDAAKRIHEALPDARFLVPLSSRDTREFFEHRCYEKSFSELPITLLYGHAREALLASDVALIASGTATLEAAICRCPHVAFYRVNAVTAWLVRRKLLLPWIALPNILAGRWVIPELLQEQATVENLVQALLNLYADEVLRRRIEALFGALAGDLADNTSELTANAVTAELKLAGIAC